MKNSLFALLVGHIIYFTTACNPSSSNSYVAPAAGPDSMSGYLLSVLQKSDSSFFWDGFEAENAFAAFLPTPGDTTNTILVDSVLVNNILLEVDVDSVGYLQTGFYMSSATMANNCNWQIVGNGTIPSFTYNFSIPYPSFTGTLFDTIISNNGIAFQLNFTGADSVVIGLGTDSIGNVISKTFQPSSSSQLFTAADIANLPLSANQGGAATLYTISAFKSTVQTYNGKKFLFTKSYQHGHWAWVK